MRITPHFIFVLAILVLLSSCSSERNFSKRKYLPGFFHDREGKKEITAAENQEQANALRADSSAAKPDFKAAETKGIPSEDKSSDSVPVLKKQVPSIEKKQAENSPELIPAKKNTATDETTPGFDEQKRIRLALIFALIAVALFLAVLITTIIGTVGLFTSLGLLVALGCAITGMILTRKVRFMHPKGESYEGKNKVVIARVIGIIGIVLTAAFIALLAFAIAVFAYGW